jgi:1,4-dihydroxy-2-naphthoate octaprenyltransferase
MIGFFAVLVVCVAAGALPWLTLASIGGLPLLQRAQKALAKPRPAEPPKGFPIWPLWFVAFVFTYTRRTGALLVAGLALAVIIGATPDWMG